MITYDERAPISKCTQDILNKFHPEPIDWTRVTRASYTLSDERNVLFIQFTYKADASFA